MKLKLRYTSSFLIASISALAFSGCTTLGPDYETPETALNNEWSQSETEVQSKKEDVTDWWSVFNDPVLDNLINVAYQQNLPLQISGLRIFEARARLGIAIGQQYPQDQQLNGALTRVGLSENSPNFVKGVDDRFAQADLGFGAAWELDFWGRFRRGVESASANLGASVADYDNALVLLNSEVARVYVTIRTLQERLEIARNNTLTQERSYKIADIRYQNGAVSELDPSQALSLLRQTEATIPLLVSQVRSAKYALSILLGMPPGELQGLLMGDKAIPDPPIELNVGIPADLLRRRPDIRRSELNAAAQSALIGVAKADLYPRFALAGSIGVLVGDTGSNSLSDFSSSDSLAFNYGPSVSWPILNYGRLKNQVRVQDARFEELLVAYRNLVLNAAREVEDGVANYVGATSQVKYLKGAVTAAQRAVEIALVQYREGATDYQRVLDTQRSLLEIEDQYTNVRGDVVLSLVSTYKALGGGWQIRVGDEFVPQSTQERMAERTDWGRLLEVGERSAELPSLPPTGLQQPLLNKPRW